MSATAADFRAALHAHLAGLSALTAVVGSRIYPNRIPQQTTAGPLQPTAGFVLKSWKPGRTLDGPDGTALASVEIEARAVDLADAQAAADAVAAALEAIATGGALGSAGNTIKARWTAPDGAVDEDPEEPDDGTDLAAFRIVDAYRIEVDL